MADREIWCASGNRMVTLPEEAFNQSLLAPSVTISPCNGCKHAGHVKTVVRVDREVAEGSLIGVKRVAHLEHSVQVINYLGKEHVQCTCNCYPQTVKED